MILSLILPQLRIRIFRNTATKRLCVRRIPIRQTLVWFGPLFFLIQRGARA